MDAMYTPEETIFKPESMFVPVPPRGSFMIDLEWDTLSRKEYKRRFRCDTHIVDSVDSITANFMTKVCMDWDRCKYGTPNFISLFYKQPKYIHPESILKGFIDLKSNHLSYHAFVKHLPGTVPMNASIRCGIYDKEVKLTITIPKSRQTEADEKLIRILTEEGLYG